MCMFTRRCTSTCTSSWHYYYMLTNNNVHHPYMHRETCASSLLPSVKHNVYIYIMYIISLHYYVFSNACVSLLLHKFARNYSIHTHKFARNYSIHIRNYYVFSNACVSLLRHKFARNYSYTWKTFACIHANTGTMYKRVDVFSTCVHTPDYTYWYNIYNHIVRLCMQNLYY